MNCVEVDISLKQVDNEVMGDMEEEAYSADLK